jgi:hypothetical protein
VVVAERVADGGLSIQVLVCKMASTVPRWSVTEFCIQKPVWGIVSDPCKHRYRLLESDHDDQRE